MKRFLPLFILTGLLFGQDGLFLKSGEFYKGRYVKKADELIVFQVEGVNHFTPFPINDVAIIKTSNWGELTYPFDIPTNSSNYWNIDNWYIDSKFKNCALSLVLLIWLAFNAPM